MYLHNIKLKKKKTKYYPEYHLIFKEKNAYTCTKKNEREH